jgi:hypothetical protein
MILINSSHEIVMSYKDSVIIGFRLYKDSRLYTPVENEEIWFYLSIDRVHLLKTQVVYNDVDQTWLVIIPTLENILEVGRYSYDLKLINTSEEPEQQYTLIYPTLFEVVEVVPDV